MVFLLLPSEGWYHEVCTTMPSLESSFLIVLGFELRFSHLLQRCFAT
jgi:hypothetical protein